MRFRLLFLWLLLAGNALCAQKVRYNVQACTLSVTDKSKIQSVVEFEAAYFAEVFGPKKVPALTVNVYGERKLYKKRNPPPGSQGFYPPGTRMVYVLYSAAYLNTCYHESSHVMFDVFAKHKPTWINEGVAEYFEFAKVDSAGTVSIYAPKWRKTAMREIVSGGELKISGLLDRKYRWFHSWRESRNYSLSWGIVYYLMTEHRDTFGTILYRIGTGTDSAKAINDAYTGGVEQLEKDLVEYYN